MTTTQGMENEIEEALAGMTDDERRLLGAWCAENGVDERTAVARLAFGELKKRLNWAFSDLKRKPH